MIINYIKTSVRNIVNNKIYSMINILGLSIGFAACLLIIMFVINELSYDRFHNNYEDIYRVSVSGRMSGDYFNVAVTPIPFAPAFVEETPEVLAAVRFQELRDNVFLSYENKKFYETEIFYTDSSLFDVFSFNLILGDEESVLDEPFSILLSESTAEKYFKNEDPVGKVLRFNDAYNFKVTGVFEDIPDNSHLKFDILASWSSYERIRGEAAKGNWGSLSIHSYIRLNPRADTAKLNDKLDMYIMKKFAADAGLSVDEVRNYNIEFHPYLQPLKAIHLHSDLMAEISSNSDVSNIYIFGAIAFFIILIACINFMNLTTARSARRAKEVGIRKVHGAVKKQLVGQFLGESLIYSLIAMVLAAGLVELALPVYNTILDESMEVGLFNNGFLIVFYILFAVLIGFIAGIYPAFYLSSFLPIKVIKGNYIGGSKKSLLRNILVVFQFSISIFLIIGTGMIYSQLNYMRNTKLGFDKEQIITIPLRGDRLKQKYEVLKEELRTVPGVVNIAASNTVPGRDTDGTAFFPEGEPETEPWLIFNMMTDIGYIETMGMEMLSGREFSEKYSTDSSAIVINETLMKKLGWTPENSLGKKFSIGDPDNPEKYHVVGVVKDFHFKSLYEKIEPLIMNYMPDRFYVLNLRIAPDNINKTLQSIESKWNSIETSFPFDYMFLDQDFDNLYKSEERTGKLFIYFTVIAIFIACLGLFGLASFTAEQRTKEIGVRKAIGASVGGIVLMLSKEYTRWVLVANIIAWPVTFYFISIWLENFHYNIEILDFWWMFIVAAAVSLAIAIITVLYQSIRAATSNPVNALKYE